MEVLKKIYSLHAKEELVQYNLQEALSYNSVTGEITWKINPNLGYTKAGDIAGTVDNKGYIVISVGYKRYKAHRLAWYLYHGQWPKNQIDHIDQNKQNNAINNLRDVTQQINQSNTSVRKDSTSGYKGINWNKKRKKWQVRIQIDGKRKELGFFDNIQSAAERRKQYENYIK